MRTWLNRHQFLVAFGVLSSIIGVTIGLAKITTSLYAISLGASERQLGLIAGASSVGVLMMSLPIGVLIERYGPQRLFVIGTVCGGVLYAVLPLQRAPDFLLVCTLAIGFFMPFRFIAMSTIFLRQLATLGNTKAGWYRGTNVAGMFLIGPMLAPSAIARFDYAGTYWLICGAFALTLALSPIVLNRAEARLPMEARSRASAGTLARLLTGLRDPELRTACATELGVQIINVYYSLFIVAIAITQLGWSQHDAAGLVAVEGSSYVLSLFALGGLATRLGPSHCALISTGMSVLALTAIGLARERLWLQGGGFLLGLGLGLLQTVNLMRFARIGQRLGHGQTAGMNALAGPLGGLLGSVLGGWLGQLVGAQPVFLWLLPLALTIGWAAAPRPRLDVDALQHAESTDFP